MTEVLIYDPLERFLSPIGICILFLCTFLYYNKGRNKETINSRMIMYGFSFWLLGFALYFSLQYLSEFFIPGSIQNTLYFGDYQLAYDNYAYSLLGLSSVLFLYGCYSIYLYTFEFNFRQTRFLLTFISLTIPIGSGIIYFSLNDGNLMGTFAKTYGFPFFLISSFYIIFKYTKHSDTNSKAISAILVFGIMMVMYAQVFRDPDMKMLESFPLVIPPILLIIGSLIAASPVIINPAKISKALPLWRILGYSLIILMSIGSILLIIARFPILYTGVSILLIMVIAYLQSVVLKMIKTETNIGVEKRISKERELKIDNILEMFARPDSVEVEEANYMRDHKICIVCKKNVEKFTYICSNCEGYYCFKCAEALTEIENVCWVCESPFDESKPTKKSKEIEDPEFEINTTSQIEEKSIKKK